MAKVYDWPVTTYEGKTLEEAKAIAANALNVSQDLLDFELVYLRRDTHGREVVQKHCSIQVVGILDAPVEAQPKPRGRPRKSSEGLERLNISLRSGQTERLRAIAEANNLTVSGWIQQAIDQAGVSV